MSERRTSLIGGLLVAIGPVSMALYTPAMPALVEAFGTTEAVVKLTLAVYFAGFSVTQLICGPISDAAGRRPTTLAFMVLYLAGSILAVLAPDIGTLLVARLLQGIGSSVGVATSRAIVRDQFTGEQSSRIMNTIGIVLAIGPALSPTIGGITLALAGWHAIFVVMVFFGLIVVGVTLGPMRETVAPDWSRIRPGAILRAYGRLATNRHFLASSLTIGGSAGALYTLATILPFVLIDTAGLTPTQFGIGMLAQSGTYLGASVVVRLLLPRFGAQRLVPVGLGFIAAGSLALVISIAWLSPSYLSIMLPVAAYAFGIAFVMPAMTTAALAPFAHMAGAASAGMGFVQMGTGMLGGLICAAIGHPVLAMQTVIPSLGLIAIVSYLIFRREAHHDDARAQMPAAEAPEAGT